MTEKISEGLVQADASAPALSEKFNHAAEWSQYKFGTWYPIECAPRHGFPVLVGWSYGHWEAGKASHDSDLDAWGELESDMSFVPYPDQPTHWMPLPSQPTAEVNFSKESESDAVSLNQSLSESIRSLTKAGKGE